MQHKTFRGLALSVLVILGTAGCQDLVVENLNDPDRFRANSDPAALEGLGAGAFSTYFATMHATNVTALFPHMATEMTSTTNVGGFFGESQIPRPPHANPVTAPALSTTGAREHWAALLRVVALADDVLRLTDPGLATPLRIIIDGVDHTPRSRAFGKLMQGMAWGAMANVYDQVIVVKPDEEIPQNPTDAIVPADEALAIAIASIDEAIAIAQANDFVIPGVNSAGGGEGRWFGSPDDISTARFIQIANTVVARLLVTHARTPAERELVNWNEVLARTNAGLQSEDLTQQLSTTNFSLMLGIHQNDATSQGGCTTCSRWDNRLIGHGDISGEYQTWIALDPQDQGRIFIVSPDRRLQGPEGNTALGSYTRHTNTLGAHPVGRPSYYHSRYQWRRHAHSVGIFEGIGLASTGRNQGLARLVTADENTLYAAEAHLMLGNAAQARDLINVTRTRPQIIPPSTTPVPNLPPVTLQGAPNSAPGLNDCVPKTDAGQCGDLLVALWYERMIELAGIEATRGWRDNRGFGLMQDQSWLQLPIPGNELDQLGLPLYTFGGPGGESSAVYAPVGSGWSGNP